MYLRLKARLGDTSCANTPGKHALATRTGLCRALQQRHYAAFDWHHGGPPGPIKFIDVHQLELAGRQALNGDDLALLMVRRYVRGIRQLLGRDGGAAQYASGLAWDRPCQHRTLAGQAAAIQAFTIAGRLARCQRHYRCVAAISAFTAACWHATVERLPDGGALANPAALRDRAWYASALLAFAEVYDAPAFYRRARDSFALLETSLHAQQPDPVAQNRTLPALGLDEAIAVAAAVRDFGVAGGRCELLRLARDLIVIAAARYCHPEGGWGRPGSDGTPLDIDATIELVRVADSLRSLNSRALNRISADGKRALFAPLTALARNPESGLLLLDADVPGIGAAGDAAPTARQGARERLSA